MRSIDIIEDNAGWYETWGCLVWVPSLYTNHMHCAVRTPSGMSFFTSSVIGIFCLLCILLNYWCDRQRQVFRETNGKSMLWWPAPPEKLEVSYTVNIGGKTVRKTNFLLVNGFWGVVRHPQYIFELLCALSWGLLTNPTLRCGQSLLYFIFLTILLCHRALRDAAKCKAKYGAGYSKYAERVKYMVIPYVF
jgi:7-dehydrocholesterol reductase